ncbi:lipocalin-like domain-containing protein [Streptomyces sp. P9-A2]|uniref:lipocalin-like domain-containing protein n=1 Tax=Streptomyces sp. P9-A2 TaxID=3072284 RepID=UPI002FCA25A7
MGDDPRGIIMCTPNGYVSAQLSSADRPGFAPGDWFDGTTEEHRYEASTYIAYSGPFHVDEEAGTLTHRGGAHDLVRRMRARCATPEAHGLTGTCGLMVHTA